MATTKASATKKSGSKKSATSTVSNRKATAKKTGANTIAQASTVRSFKVAKSPEKFTSFKLTRQTLYWVILIAFIIFAQLWIIKLQVEIGTLLDTQQTQLSAK